MSQPIVSISGLRGIVGESFTAEIIVPYVASFAQLIGGRRVVVGGDSRPSRQWAQPVVEAVLRARGLDVISIGLAPTPTVGMAVREHKAAGGIAITASHNPSEWNGLKFFNKRGEFLGEKEGAALKDGLSKPATLRGKLRIGSLVADHDMIQRHIEHILELIAPHRPKKPRRLRVVLDLCNGAGSEIGPRLASALGLTPEVIFANPGRTFPHAPEPLPKNITALAREVRRCKADFGAAFDPDADRLALVDEHGVPLGEERTLLLAADAYLRATGDKSPIVANLSSSMALDHLAAAHGVALHRTRIGEAHVLAGMRKHGAAIGGEGNGGVILPAVHPGRDCATALALITLGLQARSRPLSRWNASYPDFAMIKTSAPTGSVSMKRFVRRARGVFGDAAACDETDGIKFIWADRWLHLRPSNTEPILRVFAEAADATGASELLARTQALLK